MSLPDGRVNTVLKYVQAKVKNDGVLGAYFGDVTLAEFPFCENYPSININARDTIDDAGAFGMGRKQRTIRVQMYVTVQNGDYVGVQGDVWAAADAVRALLEADRYFGVVNVSNLLENPIVEISARAVSGPFGMAIVGTRVLEFDAVLRENLI